LRQHEHDVARPAGGCCIVARRSREDEEIHGRPQLGSVERSIGRRARSARERSSSEKPSKTKASQGSGRNHHRLDGSNPDCGSWPRPRHSPSLLAPTRWRPGWASLAWSPTCLMSLPLFYVVNAGGVDACVGALRFRPAEAFYPVGRSLASGYNSWSATIERKCLSTISSASRTARVRKLSSLVDRCAWLVARTGPPSNALDFGCLPAQRRPPGR
jgi:hypothetical protein